MVSLEPGDMIGLRHQRSRRTEYVNIAAVYDLAVKMRALMVQEEKRNAKKQR